MYESTNKKTIKMSNNSTMSWAGMAKAAPKAKENINTDELGTVSEKEQDTVSEKELGTVSEKEQDIVSEKKQNQDFEKEQDIVSEKEQNQILKKQDASIKEYIIIQDNFPTLESSAQIVKKLTKSAKKLTKVSEKNSNINLETKSVIVEKPVTVLKEQDIKFEEIINIEKESVIVEKPVTVLKEQDIKFEEIYNDKENNFYVNDYDLYNEKEINISKENSSLITRLCKTKLLEYNIKDTAFKYKNTLYSAEISNKFAEQEYKEAFDFMYKKVSNKYMNSSELINMFVICNDSNIWSFHDEKLEQKQIQLLKESLKVTNPVLLSKESVDVTEPVLLLKESVDVNEPFILLKESQNTNSLMFKQNKDEEVINYNNLSNFNQRIIIQDEWIEASNTRNKKPFVLDHKKLEKNDKLKEFAKDFANSLIKNGDEIKKNMNNNTELLYKISIDCTNKVLGFIGDMSVIPSKFLDPTYIINNDSKIQSAAHIQFKIEFLSILENKIGKHNMHIRWDKDDNENQNPNKNMLFHICFFKKRFKNNYLSDHFKQNY